MNRDARRRARPGRRAFIGVTTGLVAGALVAACGGSGKDASPPTAGQVDVNATCALLPREDVEKAIAAPVKDGEGTSGTACRFELADGPDQAVLLIKNTDPTNRANFERAMAEAKDVREVPGVVDRAFVAGNQGFVIKGDTIAIAVANLARPAPALTEAATKLALAMAPRV